jgi:hypothetical protein
MNNKDISKKRISSCYSRQQCHNSNPAPDVEIRQNQVQCWVSFTFMLSHLETARSGLSARKVLRARKAVILARPAPSAAKLTSDT